MTTSASHSADLVVSRDVASGPLLCLNGTPPSEPAATEMAQRPEHG